MKIIYNKIFLEHDTGVHPENKKRLESCGNLDETEIENGEKYLHFVHSDQYISEVRNICKAGGVALNPDTVVSTGTYQELFMRLAQRLWHLKATILRL